MYKIWLQHIFRSPVYLHCVFTKNSTQKTMATHSVCILGKKRKRSASRRFHHVLQMQMYLSFKFRCSAYLSLAFEHFERRCGCRGCGRRIVFAYTMIQGSFLHVVQVPMHRSLVIGQLLFVHR